MTDSERIAHMELKLEAASRDKAKLTEALAAARTLLAQQAQREDRLERAWLECEGITAAPQRLEPTVEGVLRLIDERDAQAQRADEAESRVAAQESAIQRLDYEIAKGKRMLAAAQKRADEAVQFANAAAESRDAFAAQAAELRRALEGLTEEVEAVALGEFGGDWADQFGPLFEATESARAALALTPGEAVAKHGELADYLRDAREFSARTFGPGRRTMGVTKHIEKEIAEVRAKPDDLTEWVDIIILAADGYWRHGGQPENLLSDMLAKLAKNKARKWPAPTSEDEPVEHDRTHDGGGDPLERVQREARIAALEALPCEFFALWSNHECAEAVEDSPDDLIRLACARCRALNAAKGEK